MKHLGDITKISGFDAAVVDVIIGGSPCQDLSIAGKRAGLAGERSGLYMEQIRIIKEMREADVLRGRTDELVRPRYMVWENVPGAFSSNGGKDFAAVLEEAIRVAEPEAPPVSVPDKGWPTSGCFYDMDGRWSVAWRVFDAQFWGVPQRRRRIALVADFGGLSAPEILFVRKGVSGHSEPGKPKGKETAGDAGEGSGGAGKGVIQPILLESNQNHATIQTNGVSTTLSASMGMGGGYVPMVTRPVTRLPFDTTQVTSPMNYSHPKYGDPCHPIAAGAHPPAVAYSIGNGQANQSYSEETIGALNCMHDQQAVCYGVDCRNFLEQPELYGTIKAKPNGGQPLNYSGAVRTHHIVRRLTPLECERLQGYPDGWTDIGEWVDSKGKKHKEADSPRYKALGNSIALPNWVWILKRISAVYELDATMASLFDGIGGFPLIWERINGKGSCLWASEIEEFPMAVTKLRFGDE